MNVDNRIQNLMTTGLHNSITFHIPNGYQGFLIVSGPSSSIPTIFFMVASYSTGGVGQPTKIIDNTNITTTTGQNTLTITKSGSGWNPRYNFINLAGGIVSIDSAS